MKDKLLRLLKRVLPFFLELITMLVITLLLFFTDMMIYPYLETKLICKGVYFSDLSDLIVVILLVLTLVFCDLAYKTEKGRRKGVLKRFAKRIPLAVIGSGVLAILLHSAIAFLNPMLILAIALFFMVTPPRVYGDADKSKPKEKTKRIKFGKSKEKEAIKSVKDNTDATAK